MLVREGFLKGWKFKSGLIHRPCQDPDSVRVAQSEMHKALPMMKGQPVTPVRATHLLRGEHSC